jgi:hypothetical protein
MLTTKKSEYEARIGATYSAEFIMMVPVLKGM